MENKCIGKIIIAIDKKKEQRELIKKHLLNQKDEVDTDTIIIGSASKVTVVKKVYGVWKQTVYPASKQ